MKKVLLYIWCLPQNLLGLIVSLFVRKHYHGKHETANVYIVPHFSYGFSLGEYIVSWSESAVPHEYGHTRQSHILGWLYLLVIALPSMIWCLVIHKTIAKKKPYSWFYTEKWADKLAK